jgi:hypothetical protein
MATEALKSAKRKNKRHGKILNYLLLTKLTCQLNLRGCHTQQTENNREYEN